MVINLFPKLLLRFILNLICHHSIFKGFENEAGPSGAKIKEQQLSDNTLHNGIKKWITRVYLLVNLFKNRFILHVLIML